MMLNVVYYDCNFKPVNLRLVDPPFGLQLVTLILELDYLRKKPLGGTTRPLIFFQLKNIFHLLESIGSARIEENQTTLAECIEGKIEGSKNPGDCRKTNVVIGSSSHTPPDASTVPSYMEELFNFINKANPPQYDLLKVAIVHHRFVWIHPFDNSNGKVVRLLTYAMLIKYGFRVHIGGRIINPTAVFCNNRENYYRYLSLAGDGSDESLLLWCEYVLDGLKNEISKIDKLLDYEFLAKNILFPVVFCFFVLCFLGVMRGQRPLIVCSIRYIKQGFRQ